MERIEEDGRALKGVERIEEDGPFLLTKMIYFFFRELRSSVKLFFTCFV